MTTQARPLGVIGSQYIVASPGSLIIHRDRDIAVTTAKGWSMHNRKGYTVYQIVPVYETPVPEPILELDPLPPPRIA